MARHFLFMAHADYGHVLPTLAVVTELIRRGNRVSYLIADDLAGIVEETGASALRYESRYAKADFRLSAHDPLYTLSILLDESEAMLEALDGHLAADGALAGDIPDLIVYDIGVLHAGRILARKLKQPATQLVPMFVSNANFSYLNAIYNSDGEEQALPRWVDDMLARIGNLARSHGVDVEPAELWWEIPDFSVVDIPRSFQFVGDTFDERFAFVGPCLGERDFLGEWQPPASGLPVMLVSFGVLYNQHPGFFQMCVKAFTDVPWHVVITVADGMDPADLGPLPPNIEVHRWVPHVKVLQHASVAVTHGGMGTVMEALHSGCSLVVVPTSNIDALTARRIEELGLGRVIPPEEVTGELLVQAVFDVAEDEDDPAAYGGDAAGSARGGRHRAGRRRTREVPAADALMGESLEFRIMGSLGVLGQGEELRIGGPRERAILASLVLNANRVVGVDRLIEAVWGGFAPQSARGQIAICVSRLRRALEDRGGRRRGPGAGDHDLQPRLPAEDGTRSGSTGCGSTAWWHRPATRRPAGDREGAIILLRDALALWRGTPFEDIHSMRYEAARLRESRLEVIESCLELELELGNHLRVIAELVPVVEEYPLRERARAQLMLAQYRSGRRAESLRTYQEGRRHLVEQVGLEPGPELRRLHDQILRDESALMRVTVTERAEEFVIPSQLPPQALPFTGRTAELAVLDDALRSCAEASTPGTVVVTGLGGFGKTALALRWAYRRIDRFPDGQLFADLQGTDGASAPAPGVVADRFLRALGVPGSAIPDDLSEKLALYRSRTARRRLLVVLDNARDSAQVIPLLPGGAHCRVIVTSRDPLDEFVARQGAHRSSSGRWDSRSPGRWRSCSSARPGGGRAADDDQARGQLLRLPADPADGGGACSARSPGPGRWPGARPLISTSSPETGSGPVTTWPGWCPGRRPARSPRPPRWWTASRRDRRGGRVRRRRRPRRTPPPTSVR